MRNSIRDGGKTTKAQVEHAKKVYREAMLAHWSKGRGTLAEGEYLNELKANALVLIEAYRLGV